MAIITLRVFTKDKKTHTRISVGSRDTLVFKNDSQTETLRVTVDKPDALIEDGKQIAKFEVKPEGKKSFSMNQHYPLESMFKYTAKIGSSEAEDPIIIIDHR